MEDKQLSMKSYPLRKNQRGILFTQTGANIDDITFENILSGKIKADDCRISKASLLLQASIAEEFGNVHMAENFRRASEMVEIESKRIIEIYNALRPYRSTEEELRQIAENLREEFNAERTAVFIEEAASILKKRKRLKGDR